MSITIKKSDIKVIHLVDEHADTDYLRQEGFESRLKEYQQGYFEFIGVRAIVELVVKGTTQKISSGGLWGIENDSDDEYLKEIGQEQTEELIEILQEMGIRVTDE